MKSKNYWMTLVLLICVFITAHAQEKNVSGTVTDQDGLPLPGVSIVVVGTTTGTQTDFDGNYSIMAGTGQVLRFSYIGQKTVERTVGASTSINVQMEEDAQALEEVVVTAMGIQRKPDELTSSSQVVKAEQLVQASNPDAVSSLTGKVSGLQINTTSSGAADQTRIMLRGVRSLTGNNQALIVVDGVITNADFLKNIDPNTIESANVMKGPNGAALYGSAGVNGAIIITTKKGNKEGEKFTVDIKTSADVQFISFIPERQTRYGQGWSSGDGFANYTYENGGWGPEFDGKLTTIGLPQADGEYIRRPYSSLGYDNILPFFHTGLTTQNSVQLSVGNNTDGYINLSAQKRETEFVIRNDKLSRNTFSLKAGKSLGKWTVSGEITYIKRKLEEASRGLYDDLLQVATNIPVEAFEHSGNEGHWNGYYYNPYWLRDNIRSGNERDEFNLTGELAYKFNDNINAVLRSNLQQRSQHNWNYANAYEDPQSVIDITGFNRIIEASFGVSNYIRKEYYTDFLLNFDYDLTEDLEFKANVGANNRYRKDYTVSAGGTGLTVPGIYNVNNLSSIPNASNYESLRRRYSFFGQVDLGYKNFLFLNATGRNDWSSVLSKENNSFFYPSVGLSFVPTKAFGFGGETLNQVKVYANYVEVGNDGDIAPYRINTVVVQPGGFPYGSLNSFVNPTNVVDPNLTPEFITSYEFGLNLGMFNNRITLDAAYYISETTDQIMATSASHASGLTGTTINIGDSETKGFEVDLGLGIFDTENFGWDMNISYSTNKTIVGKLASENGELYIGGYQGGAGIYAVEGEEFPMIKGRDYLRDPDGRVIINQQNGNPSQAPELKTLGFSNPDYIIGLNTSLRYKGFTLSGTLDYRTGHQIYSNTRATLAWPGHLYESGFNRGTFIFPNSVINTGTAENPVYEPNTSVTTGNTSGSLTQFYSTYVTGIDSENILDATAFRVRELSLRYDVPKKLLEKTPLNAISIALNARNPFMLLPEENRGYADPESNFNNDTNAQGITNTEQYPATKTYGFSLNVIF